MFQALDLLKGSSVSLKRVAPSGSARPSFHTSGSAFNDLAHSPEKKRRKQANPTSKDNLFSSGAMSYSPAIASGLSEVLAAAAAAASRTSTPSDGSHYHRQGQHSGLSKSASLTISSLSTADAHTQSNALSRLSKTLMVDNLMPPPPPLLGEVTTDTKDLSSNKYRPARLNPNTGLLETRVSGGESSSEGEGDQELECRSSIRSVDLAITNNKQKETTLVVSKSHHQRKQSQPQPVKLHHGSDMALKLKLKIPPVQQQQQSSSNAMSRTSSTISRSSSGVAKRFESQDEPKLPKLILSMRDKTVKMAGAKTKISSAVW